MSGLIALVLAATLSTAGQLSWPAASGAQAYRVWRCPDGACSLKYYTVAGVRKPFPVSLGQWELLTETSKRRRSVSIACGYYEYSVQSIARNGQSAPGGNVVSCGVTP